MREIIRGFTLLALYKLGFIKDYKFLSVIGQRRVACNTCPLRSGNWCSKKKSVSEIDYNHRGVFRKITTKVITGCGCFLPAKIFTSSHCPLNRFAKFSNKKND